MFFNSLVVLSLLLFACTPAPEMREDSGNMTVTVSILPQKYFVDRIGGDLVDVNVMVGPGESPHSYEPRASQMASLSESLVYFSIGVEFEDAWMDRISSANQDMQIIDLSEGIDRISAPEHSHHEDSHEGSETGEDHDADEEHQEMEELDPHIWTSPANGAVIARKIYRTLAEIDPENGQFYKENLDSLLQDIENLQVEISDALKSAGSGKFMVFHPAWGYFAREFGLEQLPVEVGGSEPSAQELAEIISEAEEEGISVIFAQPEFSTRSADYIADEIGGRVILISPLAEDWLSNLNQVAEILSENL